MKGVFTQPCGNSSEAKNEFRMKKKKKKLYLIWRSCCLVKFQLESEHFSTRAWKLGAILCIWPICYVKILRCVQGMIKRWSFKTFLHNYFLSNSKIIHFFYFQNHVFLNLQRNVNSHLAYRRKLSVHINLYKEGLSFLFRLVSISKCFFPNLIFKHI